MMVILVISVIMIFLAMVATIFLIVSKALNSSQKAKLERCTEREIGVITKVRRERMGSDHRTFTYFYTYEYNIDGEVIEIKPKIGCDNRKLRVGQKIKVFFNPNNYCDTYVPEFSAVNASKLAIVLSYVFYGISAVLLVVDIVIVLLNFISF